MTRDELLVSTSRARSSAVFPLQTSATAIPGMLSEITQTSGRFKLKGATGESATLTVGFTWRAWAGEIELHFSEARDGWTRVEAKWRPTVITTVVDYGQGAKDLRQLHADMVAATER
jgi:hypothetical protein